MAGLPSHIDPEPDKPVRFGPLVSVGKPAYSALVVRNQLAQGT
jgi:hypothetical protein